MQWNPTRVKEYLAWGTDQPQTQAQHRMHPSVRSLTSVGAYTETREMTNPQSHNVLVDQCYLNYHGSQLIVHGYGNPLGMETIRATRLVVVVTTLHDLTTIQSPNLSVM